MKGSDNMKDFGAIAALWKTAKSIIPLTAVLALFQVVILKKPIYDIKKFSIGFILTVLGLHLFLKGATMILIPLGESVGRNLVMIEKRWLILIAGFIIGYLATLVEPGLQAVAMEVEELSAGALTQKLLIHGVAIGFGGGMFIGLGKILLNIPYTKVVVPLLLLTMVLVLLTPEPFGAIAFDAASATTGPVNIPINMAIAVGLASVIQGVDPLMAGFGVVGLTSMGAMISVMILGILTKF